MVIPNWLVADPAQRESAEGLVDKVLQALIETVWLIILEDTALEKASLMQKYFRFWVFSRPLF